jgi:hypothetical protein
VSDADVFELIEYGVPRTTIVAVRPDGKREADELFRSMGVAHCLEDPLDFRHMANKILTA